MTGDLFLIGIYIVAGTYVIYSVFELVHRARRPKDMYLSKDYFEGEKSGGDSEEEQ